MFMKFTSVNHLFLKSFRKTWQPYILLAAYDAMLPDFDGYFRLRALSYFSKSASKIGKTCERKINTVVSEKKTRT